MLAEVPALPPHLHPVALHHGRSDILDSLMIIVYIIIIIVIIIINIINIKLIIISSSKLLSIVHVIVS